MLLMLHFLPTTSHTNTPTVFSTMLIFHFWFSVYINHSDHPHHSPPVHVFHLQPTNPPPIARVHAMGAVQYIDGKGLRRPAKTGDLEACRQGGLVGKLLFLLGLEKLLDKKNRGECCEKWVKTGFFKNETHGPLSFTSSVHHGVGKGLFMWSRSGQYSFHAKLN